MRCELRLPDLGAEGFPIIASVWLVEPGARVAAGDRLLEVAFGAVTVDLPSPASGVLVETCVEEDDELAVGQVLGVIAAAPSA
jgi:2-oxoglutarate dehydrogenase E2 component (dihydrolipoamide succinyltransferase)